MALSVPRRPRISELNLAAMAAASPIERQPAYVQMRVDQAALMQRSSVVIGPFLGDGSETSSLEGLVAALQGVARPRRAWRPATTREALSIPAVFRAVALIANVGGSLSLKAYREGVELAAADRPRIVVRPNPFTTPRDFWRETFWSMAVYGEVFWWVAKRDGDGQALSILPVSPLEVTVDEDPRDLRYPILKWRGQTMANADFVQIVTHKAIGSLRGEGPLQRCGAAISVSVEAQDWAANFYAGGTSETTIKSAVPVSDTEAAAIKSKWAENPPNLPHVIGPTIDSVDQAGIDVAAAQALDARTYQVVETATQFGIPAKMLNAAVSGSDITYQNVGEEFDSLVRQCLLPDYLEPCEQALSDLLVRSTIARFNTDAYLRPDVRTRAEVYKTLTDAGMTPAQAGPIVGFDVDLENAPMPPAMPAAVPDVLPIQTRSAAVMRDIRCATCRRLVGKVAGAAELFCRHCRAAVVVDDPAPAGPLETRAAGEPIAVSVAFNPSITVPGTEVKIPAPEVHFEPHIAPVIASPPARARRRDIHYDERGLVRYIEEREVD